MSYAKNDFSEEHVLLCMFHEHETKVFGGKRLWDRPFYMSRHSMELVILKGSHSKTKLIIQYHYTTLCSLAHIQKSQFLVSCMCSQSYLS